MTGLDLWRTVFITAAAVGQTFFVLLYVTFPWWRSFLGRALFIKAITFAILLDVAVVGRIWDWGSEQATIVTLYGVVAFGIWSQTSAFIRVMLTNRRETWDD